MWDPSERVPTYLVCVASGILRSAPILKLAQKPNPFLVAHTLIHACVPVRMCAWGGCFYPISHHPLRSNSLQADFLTEQLEGLEYSGLRCQEGQLVQGTQ